jgi:hypothetical protein
MTREHTVAVRVKAGNGQVAHCAGHRYDIKLKEGEVASKWGDGSPILKKEFEALLEPTGHFEIAERPAGEVSGNIEAGTSENGTGDIASEGD